ncbi:hypothetical protein EDC96DRAFT_437328 [Choanephora cucurbitarum]|nr:hypothetical protein EDC96DRAFT_437328 [Choanephora cucurbitarum]
MTYQEDDWEVDINLGSSTGQNLFQRKGVFNYEPDKELALACERYQYSIPNLYSDGEDDADSSIASSSIISGQLSELSLINLDNFMYDEEPTLTAETILPDNQNKFPGTIRKLRASHKENQDHDDWNDDIEIPSRDIQFSLTKKKSYEQLLDVFDDNDSIGPSVSQRGSPCSFEQDEDSFSELDFPENMALLPKRLNEKKSVAYDRLSPASHVTAVDSNKPAAKKLSLLAKVKRENDNDDFLEGLEIKEKVFKGSISASKLPIPQPQRSTSTNKTKPGTSHFLPTRHTAYTYKQPPQRKQFSLRNNLQLMNNNTSLLRNAESSPSEKRGANGSTLIAKPKTKIPISYCSRLDNIDNLNDLQPMRSKTTKMEPKDFSRNERINIDHSWKKSGQPSKIKLIQPNEQVLRKEYHGMKYDFRTHSWKGNESGLIDFPEKPAVKKHPKLVLLTSKQRTPSKYTAIMSDSMVFKPESQSWVSPSGKENNDLDGIEDLHEDLRPVSKRMPKHSQYRNKMTEFKLSIEVKRQMMAEQQQHENLIKQWPLSEEESYMISTAGHKVPVSKYFLFTQSF